MGLLSRTPGRCDGPACGHVVGRFVAPLHVMHPRCTAIRYWRGCIAWFLGHCVCPTCTPVVVHGPGDHAACRCPFDVSPALV